MIAIKAGTVVALELKTEHGRLSDDQVRVLDELRAAGCVTGVAYGLNQAIRWLEQHEILRGHVA